MAMERALGFVILWGIRVLFFKELLHELHAVFTEIDVSPTVPE
jgi:hypothetical protein